MLFGRRRFDPQPTSPAAVLLASSGEPFSRAAVKRAHELAAGDGSVADPVGGPEAPPGDPPAAR